RERQELPAGVDEDRKDVVLAALVEGRSLADLGADPREELGEPGAGGVARRGRGRPEDPQNRRDLRLARPPPHPLVLRPEIDHPRGPPLDRPPRPRRPLREIAAA